MQVNGTAGAAQVSVVASGAARRFVARYGPVAVVTGASSGIGRALAGQLAARGLHLVVTARDRVALEALAGELRARHGVDVRAVAADLGAADGVARVMAGTEGMDVGLLVCSAGFGSAGAFVEQDLASELAMIDVNVRALTELSWRFGGRFVQRRRGGIVLLGSLVGFHGAPWSATYGATKAYVQSLGEALHQELRSAGVSVLVSAPGPVRTGFAGRAGMQMAQALTPEVVAAATLRALGRRMTVRPGWLSKVLGWSLGTLPRGARVRLMGKIMQGMLARPAAGGAVTRSA